MGAAAVSSTALPVAPHDLEAERALLGAMLISDAAVDKAVSEEGIGPEDFYRAAHRHVFEAVVALYRRAEPVDHVAVKAQLRESGSFEDAGGDAGIAVLMAEVPSAGHVGSYARIVRDTARSRAVLHMTFEVQQAIFAGRPSAETLALAEHTLLQLTTVGRRGVVRNIADIAYEELERIHRASVDGHDVNGIEMPFSTINDRIGGMQPMNLIVICGRPGMGKSVVGQTIAEHAAFARAKTVLFVTLEMSAEELRPAISRRRGRHLPRRSTPSSPDPRRRSQAVDGRGQPRVRQEAARSRGDRHDRSRVARRRQEDLVAREGA